MEWKRCIIERLLTRCDFGGDPVQTLWPGSLSFTMDKLRPALPLASAAFRFVSALMCTDTRYGGFGEHNLVGI